MTDVPPFWKTMAKRNAEAMTLLALLLGLMAFLLGRAVPRQFFTGRLVMMVKNGGLMVGSWWFNGGSMVVQWWFNGGSMVVQWWFNGGSYKVVPQFGIAKLVNISW